MIEPLSKYSDNGRTWSKKFIAEVTKKNQVTKNKNSVDR